jgi:hypothetical protein
MGAMVQTLGHDNIATTSGYLFVVLSIIVRAA